MSDKPKITLADRLEHGLVTLPEVAGLAGVSVRKINYDVAAGLLPVEKFGRSTRVQGPNAKAYLSGQTMRVNAA
ncbi:hypothetical protein [Methylocystis parvus]|uniref:DNA-binding protein n=1 Tax=Methylocystis parvus TaxID=134 RepID=A0A6B8M476_9HYPH|nr:hypothetical protein [Methylocystis parvus]QGM97711.1 hypothetical protein F7D14_09685 [Methylocystis parvus]WBJ98353.1 hypothetical protein MMG94_09905 [Methylocystis parvus OBBP]